MGESSCYLPTTTHYATTLNNKRGHHPLPSINYIARKLSALSNLAVPELDDSPIASGDAAACGVSLLIREVGMPEISFIKCNLKSHGRVLLPILAITNFE
uniref:Uncharacterized protein n=1 Tax=Medicago truncatula TaxID=3880 RepID=I3S118_MEDTR|nr:unknown [Medicago truncatula]